MGIILTEIFLFVKIIVIAAVLLVLKFIVLTAIRDDIFTEVREKSFNNRNKRSKVTTVIP